MYLLSVHKPAHSDSLLQARLRVFTSVNFHEKNNRKNGVKLLTE